MLNYLNEIEPSNYCSDLNMLALNKKQQSRIMECRVNENLNKLIERTGYNVVISNGQRIYSAPEATGSPEKGCEIFVGKIPRDMFEYELVPIFERCGTIFQFRLMMDFSGCNRGYGFLSYSNPKEANEAITMLNGYEVRLGRTIGVYKSVDNCRLFVGGIPQDKKEADVTEGLGMFVDGIIDVILYQSHNDRNMNRGFVFVEFENHKLAAMARRKLAPGSFLLWGVPILVDWADPVPEVDPEIMKQVTKLYIRKLPIELSRDELYSELLKYISPDYIIKTYKTLDYAFVHFVNREIAEESLELLKGITIQGEPVEVTWARPKMYSKNYRQSHPPNHYCTSLPPRIRKQIAQARELGQSSKPLRIMSPSGSHVSSNSHAHSSNSESISTNVECSSTQTVKGGYPITNQNGMEAPMGSMMQNINNSMGPMMQKSNNFEFPVGPSMRITNNIKVPMGHSIRNNLVPNFEFPTGVGNARSMSYSTPILSQSNYIGSGFPYQSIAGNNFNVRQLNYIPQPFFTPNQVFPNFSSSI